jgi:hypothetical protein
MTAARKKRGRPAFLWRSKPGEAFVNAVFAVQSDRYPIKPAAAIRCVLKRPEFAYLKEQYPDVRYLEKKFQEAADFWNPFFRLGKEWRKANKANYRNKN